MQAQPAGMRTDDTDPLLLHVPDILVISNFQEAAAAAGADLALFLFFFFLNIKRGAWCQRWLEPRVVNACG